MIGRFTAKGYRHLDVENLELGRLTVLVGPNGFGKTAFIRALGFASSGSHPAPEVATASASGSCGPR